ncbi:signal peptidase I [Candidatus Nomurabacteria bacterium]|nr:signal peptidase I [Candidatus Nomurabacteria bacterium]
MKRIKEIHAQLQDKNSVWYQVFDLIRFVIICLVIVIPIRIFIAQPFIVEGASMVPTFQDKNYLIVDQISYRFHKPQRGDVIVFRPPTNPKTFYIKRIVGLPGETITFDGKEISITNDTYPEGLILEEPYIERDIFHTETTTLGDNEYYVMGDNRANSSDSRVWGALDEDAITGRVWLRLWPLNHIRIHPGDYRNTYEINHTTTEDSPENLESTSLS